MVWINSDYVEEFAVLTTWLSLLIPWSVGRATSPGGAQLYVMRFPLFGVQSLIGTGPLDNTRVMTPWGFYVFQNEQYVGHLLWVGAALLFLAMFAVSVLMYMEHDVVDRLPGNGVPVIGAMMLLLAIVYTGTVVQLQSEAVTDPLGWAFGVPIGLVGLLFFYAFGLLDLFADRA
jgi:hypothetical protein